MASADFFVLINSPVIQSRDTPRPTFAHLQRANAFIAASAPKPACAKLQHQHQRFPRPRVASNTPPRQHVDSFRRSCGILDHVHNGRHQQRCGDRPRPAPHGQHLRPVLLAHKRLPRRRILGQESAHLRSQRQRRDRQMDVRVPVPCWRCRREPALSILVKGMSHPPLQCTI